MSVKLPPWADEMRSRYLAGESSLFLLHGNVRDLHCWREEDGSATWFELRAFLEKFFERTRNVIAYYNVSQGLQFGQKNHARLFRSIVDAKRAARGEEKLGALPVTAASAIPVIEDLIADQTNSAAVIIDFFEMIAPNADVSFMVHEDKANLVSLQRWANDPAFAQTDNLVMIVTEHLSDVSRRITSSPALASIQVPFPDVDLREQFIRAQDLSKVKMDMDASVLAKMTAGLTLVQIRNILRSAAMTGDPIDFGDISLRKKKIIEQECHGLVEFIPPKHNFTHVGGMDRIKDDLQRVADAVRLGNRSRVPMGMIFVGPMGTGKTFVAESFATESGLTCLKLKNFRDKWVGSTEANLEKVLGLVEALGYVLLVVDEADRGLSTGEGSDGGVNSRVIARLKEFMSDTSHRGRVVILMMTNRPDKLDVDLKRPGRFDFKIPFFFPETADERRGIFEALVRKNKLTVVPGVSFDDAAIETEGYSGAEIEAVLLDSVNQASVDIENRINALEETLSATPVEGRGPINDELRKLRSLMADPPIEQKHIDQSSKDVIPSRDTRMLDYMELLAVFECSAKRMLPERFQHLTTEEVQEKLDALRLQLGRRAS